MDRKIGVQMPETLLRCLWGVVFQLFLVASPEAAEPSDFSIDSAERTAVISGSVASLRSFYVFPEVGEKMARILESRSRRGDFNGITSAKELSARIGQVLQEVSPDKHLRVEYFREGAPPEPASDGPTPEQLAAMRAAGAIDNFGFVKVERLDGNVGYIDIRGFFDASLSGETITAALSFLAHADALIVDTRRTRGGEPTSIAYLFSYLLDKPTRLMDVHPVGRARRFSRYGVPRPCLALNSDHQSRYTSSPARPHSLAAKRLDT